MEWPRFVRPPSQAQETMALKQGYRYKDLSRNLGTWVSSQKLRLISAAVRVNQQFLCCWRLRNQHELDAVIEELSALLLKDKLHRIYEQATRDPYSFLFVYYLKPKNEMFYLRFEERFALEKEADGSGAQLPGSELFASSTRCENISCCTSVAAVQPPIVRRTGGFLKKRMTTIYVDSRKRVAGSDSDFEVDPLPLNRPRPAPLPRDSELGVTARRRLHGPPSGRLDQLQLCYCHLQQDHKQPQRSLRRQPAHSERSGAAAADYPTLPAASPTKPFSIDHMLGPSFVFGGQQVFEFLKMMAYNEVYLRCAQLANASRVLGNPVQDHAEERCGQAPMMGTSWPSGAPSP